MDYKKIYNTLIEKRKREPFSGDHEKHHIIPRALGGEDTDENLVALSLREHFVVHLLLAKIYGGRMWYAANIMSNVGRYTSKTYEWVRKEHKKQLSKDQKGRKKPDGFGEMVSKDYARHAKLSIALRGKPKTKEHVANLVASRKKNGSYACPEHKKEQQRQTMKGEGNPMYGKTHNETARKIISEANKQTIICPHCKKEGGIAIMQRWHFDNCKLAPDAKPRKKYKRLVCPHCQKEGGGAQMIANHFDNCKFKETKNE